MTSDPQTLSNVVEELVWEPATQVSTLKVEVENGHVVLSGFTDNFSQRWHAEKAARRAHGVVSVSNTVEVTPNCATTRSDVEIDYLTKTSGRWMIATANPSVRTNETFRSEVNQALTKKISETQRRHQPVSSHS